MFVSTCSSHALHRETHWRCRQVSSIAVPAVVQVSGPFWVTLGTAEHSRRETEGLLVRVQSRSHLRRSARMWGVGCMGQPPTYRPHSHICRLVIHQYYFESRENLVVAAFRRYSEALIARLRRTVAGVGDPWDKLDALCRTAVRACGGAARSGSTWWIRLSATRWLYVRYFVLA